MQLTNQVISLEQAKNLKGLGIEQQSSLFYYYSLYEVNANPTIAIGYGEIRVAEPHFQNLFIWTKRMWQSEQEDLTEPPISAFTASELIAMLPTGIDFMATTESDMKVYRGYDYEGLDIVNWWCHSLCEIMAACLIHLLSNNHITAAECNQRLLTA